MTYNLSKKEIRARESLSSEQKAKYNLYKDMPGVGEYTAFRAAQGDKLANALVRDKMRKYGN